MQIIDLTKIGDNYRVIDFPDGERQIELISLNRKDSVTIRCRITNGEDLFILMQLADILTRQCVAVDFIEVLYLMGARCDRLFDLGRPFTLRIVADVINSFGARAVHIYEPHSECTIRMIRNAVPEYISIAMTNQLKGRVGNTLSFVAPDAGALSRYGVGFDVICEKVREEATGNLLSFKATANRDVAGHDLCVIDDLCDGGGTFVGLAPALRDLNPASLSLLVTHAVQKRGIENVASAYDKVYITDSYRDWGAETLPDNVEVLSIRPRFS